MAATFVQVGHGTTSVTFTAPVQNNILVAFGFNSAATVPTIGAGWTAIGTGLAGGNATAARAANACFKVAGAGESTTQTPFSANVVGTTIEEWNTGVTASPVDVGTIQLNASGATQATASITPTAGDRLFLGFWGIKQTGTGANFSAETLTGTGGAAMTEDDDWGGNVSTCMIAVAHLELASVSGAYSATATSASTINTHGNLIVALKVSADSTTPSGTDSATLADTSSSIDAATSASDATATLAESAAPAAATSATDSTALTEQPAIGVPGSDSATHTASASLAASVAASDAVALTESASLTAAVAAADSSALSESPALAVAASDSSTLSQQASLAAGTAASDTLALTDAAAAAAAVATSDAVGLAEAQSVAASATATDAITLADPTPSVTQSNTTPSSSDTASLSETAATAASLSVADTLTQSEQASPSAALNAQDAASQSETSTLSAAATASDAGALTQAASSTASTSAADTGGLLDSSNLAASGSAQDASTLGEPASLAAATTAADTSALADQAALANATAATDAASLSEPAQLAVATAAIDATAVGDSATNAASTASSDATTLGDAVSLSASAAAQDTPTLSEAPPAIAAATAASDTPILADQAALGASTAATDSATLSDPTPGVTQGGSPTPSVSDAVALSEGALFIAIVPPGPQVLRPASDVNAGQWTTEAGSTTSLFASVDEAVPDDATFVQSPSAPIAEVVEFALDVPSGPRVGPLVLRYHYGKDIAGGAGIDLVVQLLQGATVIQTWTHTSIPAGITQAEQTVSGTVADYSSLRLRLTANQT